MLVLPTGKGRRATGSSPQIKRTGVRGRSGRDGSPTGRNGGPTLPWDRRLQGWEIAASGAAPRRPNPLGAPAGWRRGAVAQMGERCNRTAEVRGSIPLSSTSLFILLG